MQNYIFPISNLKVYIFDALCYSLFSMLPMAFTTMYSQEFNLYWCTCEWLHLKKNNKAFFNIQNYNWKSTDILCNTWQNVWLDIWLYWYKTNEPDLFDKNNPHFTTCRLHYIFAQFLNVNKQPDSHVYLSLWTEFFLQFSVNMQNLNNIKKIYQY